MLRFRDKNNRLHRVSIRDVFGNSENLRRVSQRNHLSLDTLDTGSLPAFSFFKFRSFSIDKDSKFLVPEGPPTEEDHPKLLVSPLSQRRGQKQPNRTNSPRPKLPTRLLLLAKKSLPPKKELGPPQPSLRTRKTARSGK